MKPRILFVDDEHQVLEGYRAALRKQRKRWTMLFAGSGDEALGIMEEEPVSVLVSDMRMPGMDGATLINRTSEQWPHTLRIVLSGYSEEDMILRVVKAAHHFLAKPCPPEELVAVIERVLALQDVLTDDNIRTLVSRATSLPSLPGIYTDLLEELEKPEPSIKRVGTIVEQDPSITASLLKVVNSPFFGFFGTVTSPFRAVTLLGIEALKGLVLSSSLFEKCTGDSCRFPLEHMAEHARSTGLLARCIAQVEGKDKDYAETAFLAGLLHDVGKLLFMQILEAEYADLIRDVRAKKLILQTEEKKRFGVDHAEMGAYLLGTWGFGQDVVQAVHDHHLPDINMEPPFNLAICLHVADAFEQSVSGSSCGGAVMTINEAALEQRGLLDQIPRWRERCIENPPEE